MRFQTIRIFSLLIIICLLEACAQIVPPQGGDKDITPPKLLSVTPSDSLLNTRVNKIEMKFDEFIMLNNPANDVIKWQAAKQCKRAVNSLLVQLSFREHRPRFKAFGAVVFYQVYGSIYT